MSSFSFEPYALTKLDLAALRRCDRLVVRIDGPDETAVHAIKEPERDSTDPFARDVYHVIPAPVRMTGIMGGVTNDIKRHARCFSMMSLYRSQVNNISSAINTLKTGDKIAFYFYSDYGSNGYAAKAGLHVDALELHVWRGDKKVAEFVIDFGCTPNNSARMIKGVPDSDWYKRSADMVA